MVLKIVTTVERPELVPITAGWRWSAFLQDEMAFADVLKLDASATGMEVLPTVLVLLEDEVPIGMVALCNDDLENRPELNPWLAGLYVDAGSRGKGHAKRLIEELESFAKAQGFHRLSLYTSSAQKLYAASGWQVIETFERGSKTFSIMQKHI